MKTNMLFYGALILFIGLVTIHAVPCDTNNACQNGGSCIGNSCTCVPGFTGDLCGTNVCLPTPCVNGGTCAVLSTGNFTCLCVEGFSGYNCSISPMDTDEYKLLADAKKVLQSAYDTVMSWGIKTSLPILGFVVIVAIVAAIIFYRRWQTSKNSNQSSDAMAQAMSAAEHSGFSTVAIADLGKLTSPMTSATKSTIKKATAPPRQRVA